MKGKHTIKKGLCILFLILQSLFLIFSLLLIILFITLYSKLRAYLMITLKPLVISLFISLFYVILPIIGVLFVLRKRNTYVFLYIILLLILMNVDVILLSLEYKMIKSTASYTNKAWDNLSKEQKKHVQKKLNCCGFNNKDDRSEGKCDNVGCRDVFLGIVEGVRRKSERFLIVIFLLKSLSMAVVALLSMRRKTKKKKMKKKEKKSGRSSRVEIRE